MQASALGGEIGVNIKMLTSPMHMLLTQRNSILAKQKSAVHRADISLSENV